MPAPMFIGRRENGFNNDPTRSPLLHPALSNSLSRSFGLNSPFSLSALSSSLTMLSSSPNFSSMGMSLGRSFEERPKLEAQFFRNFSCCGLDLQDLHGLLEHFEECHVAFDDDSNSAEGGMEVEMDMDENASEGTISGPPSPRMHSGPLPGANGGAGLMKKSQLAALAAHNGTMNSIDMSMPESPATSTQELAAMDAGMELDMDMDDVPSFQPLASTSSLQQQHILQQQQQQLHQQQQQQHPLSPQQPSMSAFDSSSLPSTPNSVASAQANKKKFSTAMNPHPHGLASNLRALGMGAAYDPTRRESGYSTPESSMPGTPLTEDIPVDYYTPAATVSGSSAGGGGSGPINPALGLAPSLLFPGTPVESPPSNEEEEEEEECEEELEEGSSGRESSKGSSTSPGAHPSIPSLHPLGSGVQISPSGRPYTPPSEKPFKCSVSGCDKSYKQQNGLKYHRLHGHCNQNNVGKEGSGERGEGKPYVCHVGSCGKRYKNMNGLRYHYQHSGAHGALGLQMLAQACHPPPQFPPGHKRSATGSAGTSRAGSPVGSSRNSSPAAPFHRMGV